MRKELRESPGLNNVAFHIAESIIAQSLDNLRHIEKRNVHGMCFQSTDSILDDAGMIAICREKVGDSCDGVYRSPVQ